MSKLGGETSTLKRKYNETDYQKRSASFQDDDIPENVYPIGENLFITLSDFRKKVKIHIRQYKKLKHTYYPTTDYITFNPEQFNVFCTIVPTSRIDIMDLNSSLENLSPTVEFDSYVIMNDVNSFTLTHCFTCKSGRIYKTTVNINSIQWGKLCEIKDFVIDDFIISKFKSVDFKQVFERVCKRVKIIPEANNDHDSIAMEPSMRTSLRIILDQHIGKKKGLKPVLRCDEIMELEDVNSVTDFNESVLYLNIESIALDFEKELLKTSKYQPKLTPLSKYLTERFLESIDFNDLIINAGIDFCATELC